MGAPGLPATPATCSRLNVTLTDTLRYGLLNEPVYTLTSRELKLNSTTRHVSAKKMRFACSCCCVLLPRDSLYASQENGVLLLLGLELGLPLPPLPPVPPVWVLLADVGLLVLLVPLELAATVAAAALLLLLILLVVLLPLLAMAVLEGDEPESVDGPPPPPPPVLLLLLLLVVLLAAPLFVMLELK